MCSGIKIIIRRYQIRTKSSCALVTGLFMSAPPIKGYTMALDNVSTDTLQSLYINKTFSSLSPKVRHLLCEVGVRDSPFSNPVSQSITGQYERPTPAENVISTVDSRNEDMISNGFIHFSACADMLPRITEPVEEYYEKSVASLATAFSYSQEILENLTREQFFKTYKEYLRWTHDPELFLECFELLIHRNGADDLLSLLLLCAGLERALGNVYLLRGQQCPSMLKELLIAPELEEILGPAAIKVLHVVIGPPVSMNIRNVSWHGFLSEHELPRRYIFFLLLITASLGLVLKSKGIDQSHIKARDYFPLTNTEEISKHLNVTELPNADLMAVECCILQSWIVDAGNVNFFKSAVTHYKNQRFGLCAVLLLPLLEHVLRRIFVAVNKCPDRLVTAESTVLYTTFEEILDISLPDGKNNALVDVLGEPLMDLLHDLLIYPSGSRVRDKLGHGEAHYSCVPEMLPHILFIIFTQLADKTEGNKQASAVDKLCCLNSYSSVFHPVAMLHGKALQLSSQAGQLHSDLNTSPDLNLWSLDDGFQMFLTENKIFTDIQATFIQFLENISECFRALTDTEWEEIKLRLSVPFHSIEPDIKSLLPAKMRTLYRWQRDTSTSNVKVSECEVVGILSRIILETETSLTQVRSALRLRQDQLASKQLRSRQRDNMKRLLLFLPCASLLINYITVLTAWLFSYLDDYQHLGVAACKAVQRFLKGTLRTCENVRTLTSAERNKWSQASEVLLAEVESSVRFSELKDLSLLA